MDALWTHGTDPGRLAALTLWITPESGPSAPFFPPACQSWIREAEFSVFSSSRQTCSPGSQPWQTISHLWLQQQGPSLPCRRLSLVLHRPGCWARVQIFRVVFECIEHFLPLKSFYFLPPHLPNFAANEAGTIHNSLNPTLSQYFSTYTLHRPRTL